MSLYTLYQLHSAGWTRQDDLNNQKVSDIGDNRLLQSETSGVRITDFLVHLIQPTQSPERSSLATFDLILGRFFQRCNCVRIWLVRIQQLPRTLGHSFRAARCNPIAALDLESFSCGKINFGKAPRFLQRMSQKRKQKGGGRPLYVPSLNNKPSYETPDPMQLPTPIATLQVKLLLRLHEAVTGWLPATVRVLVLYRMTQGYVIHV